MFLVPYRALTSRADRRGVFLVSADGKTVSWREVTIGIRDGDRVQVEGAPESGRVVTLGHHLVDDGSAITIPEAGQDDA